MQNIKENCSPPETESNRKNFLSGTLSNIPDNSIDYIIAQSAKNVNNKNYSGGDKF